MKQAIIVFVISMLMGRIAAPLVILSVFGSVDDLSQIRVFIWSSLLAGTAACGLLGWLQYYLVVRSNEADKAMSPRISN